MKPQIKKKNRGKKFLVFLSIAVVATITIAILVNLSNTNSTNAYTVTWKNYDGVVLETDENVKYGSIPSYDGAIPTKSGDAQYSYAFSGWSPTVTLVTGDQTYTAVFDNSLNSYTITWKNYDGTTLEVDEGVAYGSTPSYDGAIPTKSGDAQYSYAFSGWSPEVTSVTSSATYTAQFTSTTNAYTITWKNYDDTVLEVDEEVPHGTLPTYDGAIPTKSGDAQYSYAFSGWSPELTSVTSSATYTAQFTGSTNTYTITWKNYDDTVLEVDEEVPHGTFPTYDGETPTKSGDAQYSYAFSGWSPEVTSVTSNATYTAQFTSSTNAYTIIWKNYDDTVLEVDEEVPHGTFPTYDGETPTKSGDAQYSYAFSGWSPAVTSVSGNQTYTAQFSEIENELNYQFGSYPQTKVTDSSLISTLTTTAGTLPTSANAQAWTSYGYYISSSAATSYMWYIDLVNGSDEYRGVYFTSYRPYFTSTTSSTSNSYQDDNGYATSNVYWFKYDPITWRVLDMQAGKAFLMANLVLDSQDYHYSTSTLTIGGVTVYSNNYKESHIRSWLNDNFYNTAFSTEEKARIQTTTVNNSRASTGSSSNPYACANTSDKVFLLSYVEATSATYGLGTATPRQLAPSAYAKAQGVRTYTNGFNLWWLRSPFNTYGDIYARLVSHDGPVDHYDYVSSTFNGVVPALWISL